MNFTSPIAITAFSSISALGEDASQIWQQYLSSHTCIRTLQFSGREYYAAALPSALATQIQTLASSDKCYRLLDPSVLYAIYVTRLAMEQAGWRAGIEMGINFGSSRGATQLFERYHSEFLQKGQANKLSSPSTTLGNISSLVARDLKVQGIAISHSVTCSTGLHALLNGVAWLKSGLSDKFLVGASEAALTEFTLSQMQVLKITAIPDAESERAYPCRALDLNKDANTMVLGEGAAAACLQLGTQKNALAYIAGLGFATDESEHNIGISEDAICFQRSMRQALGTTAIEDIDVIVMHAPGTVKGDLAEFRAIQAVFGEQVPALTSNKWKIGHSLGAAGMLSIELALLMMQHQHFIPVPYTNQIAMKAPTKIRRILVNAVGFGGNAVSILLADEASL